jgi:hypothetical protein
VRLTNPTNRLKKFRQLYDERFPPPPPPPKLADIVRLWRDAFAFVLARAANDAGWGTPEWLAFWDGASRVGLRHPSLPRGDDDLTDEAFVELFRRWRAYLDSGGGDPMPADLFGFPSPTIWEKYKAEVFAAWRHGIPPLVFRARYTPEAQARMLRGEPIVGG